MTTKLVVKLNVGKCELLITTKLVDKGSCWNRIEITKISCWNRIDYISKFFIDSPYY